ncbi:MAG: hypothetical protein VYE22_24515 [Myxococcota bacterium]|nr:hypothetical protein [Myxococcota bacterium]
MARLLGQLRCGGCRHVFWPDRDQATATFVPCPSCGAAHVNPGAEPRALPDHADSPAALEWIRRRWIGAAPSYHYLNVMSGVTRFEPLEIDGFACCVAVVAYGPAEDRRRATFLVVAAKPPSQAPGYPGDQRTETVWQAGGIYQYRPEAAALTQARRELTRLVDFIRQAGAIPTLEMETVEAPTPLERPPLVVAEDLVADRSLSSVELSCGSCGAPSRAIELTANARCPWCAAAIAVPPAIEGALRAYQVRVVAAQRAAKVPAAREDTSWSPFGSVPLVCVRCGAPNRHHPGAADEACRSCRAPLIPSPSARALGVGAAGRLAEEGHRRWGDLRAVRELRHTARLRGGEKKLAALATLLLVVLTLAHAYLNARGLPVLVLYVVAGWVLFLGTVVAVVVGRILVARRWQPRLEALAVQLASRTVGSPAALVAWARRWWPDRLADGWLNDGPAYGVVETVVAGFPVVVGARVETAFRPRRQLERGFAMALVAAALPRDTAYWIAQPEAVSCVRALEARGFTVEPRIGGLAARARDQAIGAMVREPAAVMELAFVAFTLARLAHHLHAENH